MDKLLEIADYRRLPGPPRRAASARQAARPRHLDLHRGLRHRAVEPRRPRSAPAPASTRAATVRVNPTGGITVFTGSHSHGQGHETTFAQVVADDARHRRGPDRHRPRRHRPDPLRHGHLRLALAGGRRVGDLQGTEKIIAKAKKIAAHLMEAATPTSSSRTATFPSPAPTSRWRGRRHARGLRAAQLPARGARAGARGDRLLRPVQLHLSRPAATPARSRSTATPASSRSSRFAAADDFGNIVNPMIVDGQVHGGLAQGIGQALCESGGLRRERPAPDRLLHGLRHAAGERRAELRR